ncbi:MAG: tRNA (N(6)-L-threonylcarbamoyladenosine(37)-C(2))-methylthiotransferase MtaB [Rickettsiales bacterium]|nr:tRNA (N(6)-L-threonylcarbamoyladenosine(37)-C(2))-methylthiotransferase MtaB [Rickettsiales bacterium]
MIKDTKSYNNKENQVVTFGCRLNSFESEAIKNAIDIAGEKNYIVFNSCAVTEKAEQDLKKAIKKFRKQNPEAKIVVTGCAAQIDPKKYAIMKEVDLVLGNAEKSKAESYKNNSIFLKDNRQANIKNHSDEIFLKTRQQNSLFLSEDDYGKIRVNDIMSVRETAPQLVSYFEDQTRAFLEIQNGCNHRCTFCIIPFGRGNSRSVPFGEIIAQSRKMIDAGHKEIVLTGVDISDYGKDFPAPISLTKMIKRMLDLLPDLPRLRLSSVDVAELGEDFCELLATQPRLMPYLHLSIQSGDDLILKRMARRHNRQDVIDFCLKAKKVRPEIAFGCDIIAGFPTESNDAFNNSVNLIKELGLVYTHIFPYSARDGTPASKMPQIPAKIIKERARILREVGNLELQKFMQKNINKKSKILLEKNNFGKSENFLDVKIVDDLQSNIKVGSIVEVEIIGIENNHLLAKIL